MSVYTFGSWRRPLWGPLRFASPRRLGSGEVVVAGAAAAAVVSCSLFGALLFEQHAVGRFCGEPGRRLDVELTA